MEQARVAESGIVDGDRSEVKYDISARYVQMLMSAVLATASMRSRWY